MRLEHVTNRRLTYQKLLVFLKQSFQALPYNLLLLLALLLLLLLKMSKQQRRHSDLR